MRFFRRFAGCPLFDHKRNEEILEELKVEPDEEKIRRCKSNLLRHGTRIKNDNNKIQKTLNYRTNEQRRLGRLLKTLLDEAETGLSRSNS